MTMGPLELALILIIFIVPIALIYALVRLILYFSHERRFPHGKQNNDAISLAKERYAKGEISKDEFEEIKQTINS